MICITYIIMFKVYSTNINKKTKRINMAVTKKEQRKTIDKIFVSLGLIVAVVLFSVGLIAWQGYRFATDQVKSELTAQKIFFPPAGSPAFDPKEFPGLQQYAGQAVDNGPKAKAYANEFIGAHLDKAAGGKTYAEVSTLAKANPTDQKLAAQKQTLFQGETLRGLLLGTGYSYWTMGMLAKSAAMVFFIGSAIMTLLVILGLIHINRSK